MILHARLIYRGSPESLSLVRQGGEDPTYYIKFHTSSLNGSMRPIAEGCTLSLDIDGLEGRSISWQGEHHEGEIFQFDCDEAPFRSRVNTPAKLVLHNGSRKTVVAVGSVTLAQ